MIHSYMIAATLFMTVICSTDNDASPLKPNSKPDDSSSSTIAKKPIESLVSKESEPFVEDASRLIKKIEVERGELDEKKKQQQELNKAALHQRQMSRNAVFENIIGKHRKQKAEHAVFMADEKLRAHDEMQRKLAERKAKKTLRSEKGWASPENTGAEWVAAEAGQATILATGVKKNRLPEDDRKKTGLASEHYQAASRLGKSDTLQGLLEQSGETVPITHIQKPKRHTVQPEEGGAELDQTAGHIFLDRQSAKGRELPGKYLSGISSAIHSEKNHPINEWLCQMETQEVMLASAYNRLNETIQHNHKKLLAGIVLAMAHAALPQAYDDHRLIAIGIGRFKEEGAVSLGISTRFGNRNQYIVCASVASARTDSSGSINISFGFSL